MPSDADTAPRSPMISSSRPTITKAIHADTRPTSTRASSTPDTSSLSAAVSRKLPSVEVCFHRRARRPSKKSVAAAIANSRAAVGVDPRRRVAHEHQRHDHRRQRDAQVGDERRKAAARSSGVLMARSRIVPARPRCYGAREQVAHLGRRGAGERTRRRGSEPARCAVERTACFTAAIAGAAIDSSRTPRPEQQGRRRARRRRAPHRRRPTDRAPRRPRPWRRSAAAPPDATGR